MPVYIRKGPQEIPAYEEQDWIKDEEGDFFLKDPDQSVDSLPQPFRMINKLVNLLFDRAWEIIEEREATETITMLKFKPLVYLPSQKFQLSSVPNCLAICKGYVFVGSSNGIRVFNTFLNYSRVCSWDSGQVEIMNIWATEIGNEILIATLDEMGIVRLFYFYRDSLFLIKAINEVEDISKQTTCLNLQISPAGNFLAMLLQGAGDVWVDVYRLNKESWLKEMEAPHSSNLSRKKVSHLHLKSNESTDLSDLENSLLKTDVKLSGPIPLMKLKPPKPVTGTPFKSPLEAFQKLEDVSGLGSGQNHMIKESQLDQQTAIFEVLFRKYQNVECPEENSSVAEFHFLFPGHILMLPPETNVLSGVACALGIYWSGNHNFFLYSLNRPPRDKEREKEREREREKEKEKIDFDPKPDGVWPTAAPITNSVISACTSYLLLACEDGVITLWDRAQGFLLAVVSLPEGCICKSLHFVKISETLKECQFPPTTADSKFQFLVLCTDGSLHLVKVERCKEPSIRVVVERPVKHPNETICAVAPISFIPCLVLLFIWDGSVYLMDVEKEQIICELGPSPSYRLGNPWQPVFALSSESQRVLIRGDKKDTPKYQKDNHCIFIFKLDSYQLIKTSYSRKISFSESESSQPSQPETSDSTQQLLLNKRCENFLQNRLKNSGSFRDYRPDYLLQLRKSSWLLERDNRKK
ncbi:WD repeat-containing protein 93 isoform X1 [Sarcophilus harrisii]|uniref:WD repeat-containing protein 93 isoform X1 n=1 Tax=Sarcophilus harrisii TaxID=9305 RepID=UPI001301F50D|nr:WD repeat-containing protein 93 isoform X1 [Sarcophilus harrisii]